MPFPPDLRRDIRAQQAYHCSFCGVRDADVEVHHKVPSRDGGSDNAQNADVLCPVCHDMMDREQENGLTYEQARKKLLPYASYLGTDKV